MTTTGRSPCCVFGGRRLPRRWPVCRVVDGRRARRRRRRRRGAAGVVVVGADADLAAVLTRLLRTDRLDVEVAPRRRALARRAAGAHRRRRNGFR